MRIHIIVAVQRLDLWANDGELLGSWPVSTAAKGVGEAAGSLCTPRGEHIVRARIGEGMPVNTVFVGRRPTGEVYTDAMGASEPDRDWILTRILWLSGKEIGFNRLGTCDSMRRYIYIHGTPEAQFEQAPRSHGCIRMRNADMLELFEMVPPYTPVTISET